MTEHATTDQVQELTDRSVSLAHQLRQFQHDLAIVEEVAGLETRQAAGEKEAKRQRRWIRLTAFGLILDTFLTIGFGFVFQQVDSNTSNIKAGLCPIYHSILEKEPRPVVEDRKEFINVIQSGSDRLNCE